VAAGTIPGDTDVRTGIRRLRLPSWTAQSRPAEPNQCRADETRELAGSREL
jgi:hypothetical protein